MYFIQFLIPQNTNPKQDQRLKLATVTQNSVVYQNLCFYKTLQFNMMDWNEKIYLLLINEL